MSESPSCPECKSEYAYEMGALLVCPECAHEWNPADDIGETVRVIKDSAGNILADGDDVTIVKDMKVKGSSNTLKVGTKVRNIRLVDGPGDHDIDAKVDGFGPMNLKSSIVRKAQILDLLEVIESYREATDEFAALAKDLTTAQLDKPQNNGWTARQVIHHVADSEAQSYARLRRLIAQPGTEIQGYDEGAWGEDETLGYKELPIESSLAVFRAVRASSLEILKRVTVEQLANSGTHSESGEYTLRNWLESYVKHPSEHAAQIRSGL